MRRERMTSNRTNKKEEEEKRKYDIV